VEIITIFKFPVEIATFKNKRFNVILKMRKIRGEKENENIFT